MNWWNGFVNQHNERCLYSQNTNSLVWLMSWRYFFMLFKMALHWYVISAKRCSMLYSTRILLREKLSIFSRNANVNWTSSSCNRTLLIFFLSGPDKSLAYCNKSQTLADLKTNIIRGIDEILIYWNHFWIIDCFFFNWLFNHLL